MELPVELPEPLDRQRRRRDDGGPVSSVSPEEPREDQARLDRLPQPHLVREEPADRVGRGRPLGDMELVREEGDPSAEKRAEPPRGPGPGEEDPVEAVPERRPPVDLEGRQPLDRVGGKLHRPELLVRDHLAAGEPPRGGASRRSRDPLHDPGLLPRRLHPDREARPQHQRAQGRVGRRKGEAGPVPREEDGHPAPGRLLHLPRSQVGVEGVNQTIAGSERQRGLGHGSETARGQAPSAFRISASRAPGRISRRSYRTRTAGLSIFKTRVRSIGVPTTTTSHGVRRIVSSSSAICSSL